MKLRDIALRNLWRRRGKSAFVLAGLMIGVATMVLLVSLAQTLTMEINHKLEKYGANIIITPKTEMLSLSYEGLSLGGFTFETSQIRETDLALIKTIKNHENVAAIGPMVLGPVKVGERHVLLAGIDFEATKHLRPWWRISGKPPGRDEVILGSEAARVLGLGTGRTVELNGRTLRVAGVIEPTGSQDDALVFTHLGVAQAILDKPGLVSMVEVAALCNNCPVEEMVRQIAAVLPGARVTAIRSVVQGRMEALKHFRTFSLGVSALILLVGSLVVLVTMMANVKERTGEIGIFRAMGFRSGHVLRVILLEAAVLSIGAGIIGYLLGLAGGAASLPFLADRPGAHLVVDPGMAVLALGLALIIGLAASLYPAAMAARMDPYDALRTL